MEGTVEGAEGELGGPVELHLAGQVAGRAAPYTGQVVGGARPSHQRPDRPVRVHKAHALAVAQEDTPVDRHGNALEK